MAAGKASRDAECQLPIEYLQREAKGGDYAYGARGTTISSRNFEEQKQPKRLKAKIARY